MCAATVTGVDVRASVFRIIWLPRAIKSSVHCAFSPNSYQDHTSGAPPLSLMALISLPKPDSGDNLMLKTGQRQTAAFLQSGERLCLSYSTGDSCSTRLFSVRLCRHTPRIRSPTVSCYVTLHANVEVLILSLAVTADAGN